MRKGEFVLIFGLVLLTAGCAMQQRTAGATDAVEVARSGYAAFARGDMETVRGIIADDVSWHEAESLPYGGTYQSAEAVMEAIFGRINEDWTDYAAKPGKFIDGGDYVTVIGEYSGTHKETGGKLKVPFAHIWKVKDGKLVEFRQFTDTAAYLEAMGGAQ